MPLLIVISSLTLDPGTEYDCLDRGSNWNKDTDADYQGASFKTHTLVLLCAFTKAVPSIMSQRRLAICSYRVSDILILGGKFSYLRVELGFTDWIDSISLCYSRPSTKLIDTDPKPFLPII